MTTQHTPGPWTWVKHGSYYSLENNGGFEVVSDGSACGEYGGWMDSPSEPNARLISAAPDLLASLEEVLAYCVEHGHDWMCMAQARAAIAKATGLNKATGKKTQ